ncbi:hypothetical protein TraAM80_05554 [Trypanosoma rangeli]|uniref:Uncharacterized protein n=1 Tax=Trypanosoma rangeli TaxID=5698 RepID=A0A3R7NK59_TRYRA|nr:uncharacterized protein TraAM80_05554 [Trypanosoma rangeli]RNF03810.1 hypothetical protein TraAM80_05554 [Trypanosoma rangeli]|eukprot:RNF03810.1 hypothetical protein TraAM80_05554 [Trypanosoma rangeli]
MEPDDCARECGRAPLAANAAMTMTACPSGACENAARSVAARTYPTTPAKEKTSGHKQCEAQQGQRSTLGDGGAREAAYLAEGWMPVVEATTRKGLRRITPHAPHFAPCSGNVSCAQRRLHTAAPAAVSVDRCPIATALEEQPPYRIPWERFKLKSQRYKPLVSLRASTAAPSRREGHGVHVSQSCRSTLTTQSVDIDAAGLRGCVETLPDPQPVEEVPQGSEPGECAPAASTEGARLPQLVASEESAPRATEAVRSEQSASREVANVPAAEKSAGVAVAFADAGLPAAAVNALPLSTADHCPTHVVYVVAARALLQEQHYLEKVKGVLEECLGALHDLPPEAAEVEISALPGSEKEGAVALRQLKPVWHTRPERPHLSGRQGVKDERRVLYTALGDAVVRCAWSGSV